MHNSSQSISLTRRVIDYFLVFCLGCLFLSLATTLLLQWRGLLVSHLYLVVITPSIAMAVGVLMFRSLFRVTGEIDSQLRSLADHNNTEELNPIYLSDSIAVGWNTLIESLDHFRTSKSLESRIQESMSELQNQKHRAIFENHPEGIALTDSTGHILHANRAFLVLFHLDADEGNHWKGKEIQDVLRVDELENQETILQRIQQSLLSFVVEIQPNYLEHKPTYRVSRTRIASEDGRESEGDIWCFRDITQVKLAEEMRDQFVFTATHELRTPLSNIKAYAETLALDEQIEVEDQKKFCNIINAEVTRLSRFVDELLNVSQMEAGALSLNKQSTKFDRMLEEIVEHNRPQIDQKSIQFNYLTPAKLPEVMVDKDKISASLMNLLGNAIKYTEEGGNVDFRVTQNEKSIIIEIEDSGIGISEEELPKIYDKFFRSDDARVRAITGSGLGLAFACEAIRLHGGQLDVSSQINKGTKFTMTLPL